MIKVGDRIVKFYTNSKDILFGTVIKITKEINETEYFLIDVILTNKNLTKTRPLFSQSVSNRVCCEKIENIYDMSIEDYLMVNEL